MRWAASQYLDDGRWGVVTDDSDTFIIVGVSAKLTEDHARLIAAAPDLLTALKETRDATAALMVAITAEDLVDRVMQHIPEKLNGFGARANAAIAKAEGKTA